ncbi:MAG: TetR family transcriptional regulator [Actinobacteria bacterium]|nr:TetR family transcriptional regulator [Actinomycetota bacterium]
MARVGKGGQTVNTDTADVIERTALSMFYEKGYHGTSIREIAGGAGISVPGLFHHYESKARIVERILHRAVDEMQRDIDEALAEVGPAPRERLTAGFRALVLAHCERQMDSFVAQSELRSLEPAAEGEIRKKRRDVQHVFDAAVEEGAQSNEFHCDHPHEAARAIVALGTSVATWYRHGNGYTPDEVADIYVDMALRIAGADLPAGVPLPD